MDTRNEVREFLTTRRARITPEQVGLPQFGGRRRVQGLRREEVALLAGVSIDYYTRLERGNLGGVSDSVLEAIARALLLDDAEQRHLFNLARTANTGTRQRPPAKPSAAVRPSLQRMLDAMEFAPAYVRNGRLDILAANAMARAVFPHLFEDPARPLNLARYQFLDPRARTFFDDWDRRATDAVALLRAEAGRDPFDKGLTDLVGELSTRSEEFRVRWAMHNVREHRAGSKQFHHPDVGLLEFDYELLELPGTSTLSVLVYTAPADAPTMDALRLLASLHAPAVTGVDH